MDVRTGSAPGYPFETDTPSLTPRFPKNNMSEQNVLYRDQPLSDVFEQQSAQVWLPIEINQLSAGSFSGQLRKIEHAEGGVFFEHQNRTVHKRGTIEDDLCTVSFVNSTDRSQLRFSEYSSLDNSLFFLPKGTEFDIQVAGDVETVYFLFSQSSFLERARAMNPACWENDPDSLLIFDALDRRPLDAFAQYLYSSPLFQKEKEVFHIDSQLSVSIMDHVLMTLNGSSLSDHDYSDVIARRRARSLMRLAVEYLEAEFERHNCPSIIDICQQINVSERTLQYSFQKILGLTPNTYLRYLRLNRVQAELANADNPEMTVTNVATHWHFLHLGRFAKDYLRLFGELPSTTLNRALA